MGSMTVQAMEPMRALPTVQLKAIHLGSHLYQTGIHWEERWERYREERLTTGRALGDAGRNGGGRSGRNVEFGHMSEVNVLQKKQSSQRNLMLRCLQYQLQNELVCFYAGVKHW
jgi:hypothetical protein